MAAPPLSSTPTLGVIHLHSDYSHDGRDSLEDLRRSAEERGFAFMGLTDHAEDFDAIRFERYREHCARASAPGARLIPGLEYRFDGYRGLHLLALGLTRWIAPRTPAEFMQQAAGAAGFTIYAHPILSGYQAPSEVLQGIDAIEVWNASYNTRYLPDPRAMRLFARVRRHRPDVVATAGLDQHDRRNDRETRVVLRDPAASDPLGELRAGRFENRGRLFRFPAQVDYGPAALATLQLARWLFDGIERTQDAATRVWRRMASP